jgi:hypothetical protein
MTQQEFFEKHSIDVNALVKKGVARRGPSGYVYVTDKRQERFYEDMLSHLKIWAEAFIGLPFKRRFEDLLRDAMGAEDGLIRSTLADIAIELNKYDRFLMIDKEARIEGIFESVDHEHVLAYFDEKSDLLGIESKYPFFKAWGDYLTLAMKRDYLQNLLTPKKDGKPVRLEDFFIIEDKQRVRHIIEQLKRIFHGDKNKNLAYMYQALVDCKMIKPNPVKKHFHDALIEEFDWDIGRYNGWMDAVDDLVAALKFPDDDSNKALVKAYQDGALRHISQL